MEKARLAAPTGHTPAPAAATSGAQTAAPAATQAAPDPGGSWKDVLADASSQWFIQLSAMIAATAAGGWLAAIFVRRQQLDAARTVTDPAARGVLEASSQVFDSLIPTLGFVCLATLGVLALTLVLDGFRKREKPTAVPVPAPTSASAVPTSPTTTALPAAPAPGAPASTTAALPAPAAPTPAAPTPAARDRTD